MANTPRSKAATKQAIQAANPLDGIAGNLGTGDENDHVPEEFKGLNAPPASIDAEVIEVDIRAVLGADFDSYMAWKAEHDAAALAGKPAVAATAADQSGELTVGLAVAAKPNFSTQISESGRAPRVEDKDRVWIILDDNDEIPPGGQFIGVNGVGYMLMAGVEAFVPRAVCEVLDHAIKSIPIQDPNTKRVVGWRPRKRFPYTIVNRQDQRAES